MRREEWLCRISTGGDSKPQQATMERDLARMLARSMGFDPNTLPSPCSWGDPAQQSQESSNGDFSFESMDNYLCQMKECIFTTNEANSGPPEVYKATLPSPWLNRMGFSRNFNNHKKKLAALQASSQVLVRRSARPAIEHGISPPSLSKLKRTTLQGVARKVNHIHIDEVLFVKTIHAPYRLIGTNTLVQDESGDRLLLALYNYVRNDEEPEDVLPEGTLLALLAPFMKNSEDNRERNLMLRCDNPQCVIKFDSDEAWRAAMYGKGRRPIEKESPDLLREWGNDALRNRKYSAAAWLYSRALSSPFISNDDEKACLCNRAEVNLRQEKWELAEQDARYVLGQYERGHVKSKFRLAKSLSQQVRKLSEAQRHTEDLLSLYRNEKSFEDLYSDLQRLHYEKNGYYDLMAMEKEATLMVPLKTFHADFVSPKIQLGGRTGHRGCNKALEKIAENELIVASKAFVFVVAGSSGVEKKDDISQQVVNSNSTTILGDEDSTLIQLTTEIVEKLHNRPSLGQQLYKLKAGKEFPVTVPISHREKIDIPRIRSILANNYRVYSQSNNNNTEKEQLRRDWEIVKIEETMGGRRLSDTEVRDRLNHNQKQTILNETEIHQQHQQQGCGLWIQESLLHHSCTPNCTWSRIGDHLFIRSNRPIAVGEELCIAYTSPEHSYMKRTETFQHWMGPDNGFQCTCDLCHLIRSDRELQTLETVVFDAYSKARDMFSLKRIPMATAVNMVMSREERQSIIETFATVPLRLQHPTVKYVEIMDGACRAGEGDNEGALVAYLRAAEIGYAARGGGTSWRRVDDLYRILGAYMACGQSSRAMEILDLIWEGPYWDAFPSKEMIPSFTALTLGWTLPWWVDHPAEEHEKVLRMMICRTIKRVQPSSQRGHPRLRSHGGRG